MATAIITGGAKGIGLGVAERLTEGGWNVAIADADESTTASAAERLGADPLVVDVTDHAGLHAAFGEVAERHGSIEALVTCAGITVAGPSSELSPEDWRRVLDVDLTGTFFACQAAVGHMASGGAIVTVASIAALRGIPERAAYVSAKAGVVGLTKTLAAEWVGRGVRVNSVAPGWVDTPFLRDAAAKGYVDLDVLRERPPMKRLADVSDIVGTIEFLLGEGAGYITGQTLYVDGGWSWAA
jgi:2-hydroxycyclohexanecarboxyl-CoA dehydrogenase